jgi:hypothetical protein
MLTTSCRWRLCAAAPALALACAAIVQAAPPAPAAQLPVPLPVAALRAPSSWAALTPGQRAALAPLQADWDALEPARQGKWLEIARRFPTLSADEQARAQRRMGRWARMTAEERGRARVQFQQSRQLDATQRRTAWAAYQALSPEERRDLAARARPLAASRRAADAVAPAVVGLRPVGPALVQAAPGVSTVNINRLSGPSRRVRAGQPDKVSRTAGVDRNTLLPRHRALAAAASGASAAP